MAEWKESSEAREARSTDPPARGTSDGETPRFERGEFSRGGESERRELFTPSLCTLRRLGRRGAEDVGALPLRTGRAVTVSRHGTSSSSSSSSSLSPSWSCRLNSSVMLVAKESYMGERAPGPMGESGHEMDARRGRCFFFDLLTCCFSCTVSASARTLPRLGGSTTLLWERVRTTGGVGWWSCGLELSKLTGPPAFGAGAIRSTESTVSRTGTAVPTTRVRQLSI